MGVIVRPDDLGSIMAEVYARLDAIERTSGPMHDFAIRDPSGNMRVQGGNLAAWGISPAQEGMRVIDQYGNPIFDTLGLTQVTQQLGATRPHGLFPVSTVYALWPYGAVSFSVSRPVTILVLCTLSISIWGAGGLLKLGLATDSVGLWDGDSTIGGYAGSQPNFTAIPGGAWVDATLFEVETVAAGSHTMNLVGWTDANAQAVSSDGVMRIFQLGG